MTARPLSARLLVYILRALAAFAVVTGAMDVVLGAGALAGSGAVVPDPIDPLLDSQLRFCGGIWMGWGVALFWSSADLPARRTMFDILLAALAIGGVGRLAAAVVYGWTPLLAVLIAVEIAVPAVLMAWSRRHRRSAA